MAKLSMTDLLKEVEDEYGDLEIEIPVRNDEGEETGTAEVALKYFLRVPEEGRRKAADALRYIEDEDALVERVGKEADAIKALTVFCQDAVRAVCAKPEDYDILYKEFGDDMILWVALLEKYEEVFGMGDPSGE